MAAERSRLSILVMEDDGLLAMDLCNTLAGLGYEVVGPARNVKDAIAKIETQKVHVALLDVNLGNGQTSYPFAEMLTDFGVPFAFLTGYGESGLDKKFRDRPVVSKPINQAELVETLDQLSSAQTSR
jgi:CheY-like chemotaxis protein